MKKLKTKTTKANKPKLGVRSYSDNGLIRYRVVTNDGAVIVENLDKDGASDLVKRFKESTKRKHDEVSTIAGGVLARITTLLGDQIAHWEEKVAQRRKDILEGRMLESTQIELSHTLPLLYDLMELSNMHDPIITFKCDKV